MEVGIIIGSDLGPNLPYNLLGTLFCTAVEAGWWNECARAISQFVEKCCFHFIPSNGWKFSVSIARRPRHSLPWRGALLTGLAADSII